MKILVVAATEMEIAPFIKSLKIKSKDDIYRCIYKNTDVDILISGIGIHSATYSLTKVLASNKYDLVINAGIAGCFNKDEKLGTIFNVTTEEFGDLVIEDNSKINTLFEEGFINENSFPYSSGKLINPQNKYFNDIRKTSSITVNTVHGNSSSISVYRDKYNAMLENMEGAAVFYTCVMEKQDFVELRAVSNYVEPRNKDNWDIPLAINNLSNAMVQFLDNLNEE